MADPRQKWLVQKLVASTGLQEYECDKVGPTHTARCAAVVFCTVVGPCAQVVEKAKKEVQAFYTKDGPEKILFFFQVRARQAVLVAIEADVAGLSYAGVPAHIRSRSVVTHTCRACTLS